MTMSHDQDVLNVQDEFIFPAVRPLYENPLVLTEGQGVRVKDIDGREYLDMFAGILTTSVGHCNSKVVARMSDQLKKLGHTSTLYVTKPQVEAARLLASIAPGKLSQTFFTNSGTEAIESAIQMAFVHTGRSEVIGLRQSYHGRSFMTSNLTAVGSWRPLATSFPGIKHVQTPYPYRCPYKQPCDASCTEKFANDIEDVIRTTTNGKPAAFIAESVMGVGGYIVPPEGYFERAAEIIRSYGGLFISDEVQSGFGRSGDHWFGIEHSNVEPDIMVMAKGIANGAPVGAMTTRPEIADSWQSKTISTFGGNPISMAAASATMEVMIEENVPARASEQGGQLLEGLLKFKDEFDWIGDVRGKGLMLGLELVENKEEKKPFASKAQALLESCREEGLLVGIGGLHGHVIRLGPSLLVTATEIEEGLERFGRACHKFGAR